MKLLKRSEMTGHWEKNPRTVLLLGLGFFLAIGFIGMIIYIAAFDRVTLAVDGEIYQYKTLSSTVSKVLEEKGVQLNPADVVYPALDTKVVEGLEIKVQRAFPVTIKTAAKVFEYLTVERPVRDVLANAKIYYDQDDRIIPALDQVISSPQEIKVIDVSSKIITNQSPIASGVEYQKDKNLERGVQKVIRKGQDGLSERQIKIVYENGRERKRYILSEKMVKPKVNAIIALGIKQMVRVLETSRGSYRYIEMKVMDSTAYYPGPESCGVYAKYGRTYTGKKAGFGLVAVDPRVIPLGTKLYIEGYGNAEAADKGSAIKGNRIDLCYETYREAVMYGRKKIRVYILE